MSEKPDEDSKTEDPTEKKQRDAIEKGNTPQSRELATLSSLLGATCILLFMATQSTFGLTSNLKHAFVHIDVIKLSNSADAINVMTYFVGKAGELMLPPLLLLSLAGIAASMAQNPIALILERIRPQASRISIAQGWKRIFGKAGLVELFKALGKIIIVISVCAFVLKVETGRIVNSMLLPAGSIPGFVLELCAKLFVGVMLASLAIVIADYAWSRHKWRFDLRMTKQEVRDEMRDTDGKPEVKAAIRKAQQAIANRRMLEEVPTADVVITNPEHFAVALRYEAGAEAPTVVARGADHMALRIREVASAHSVPMLRLPPLARSIFYHCELGSQIPAALYAAVAQVLAYIQQLRTYRQHHQDPRPKLGPVHIPKQMQHAASGRRQ